METNTLEQSNAREKNNWIVIALVAGGLLLVLCLCCIGLGIGYFALNGETFISTPTQTPTLTPIPTATFVPTATFFENPTPELPALPPPLDSPIIGDFTSNTNGWSENSFTDDYGDITYTINGQYVWDIKAAKPVNYKTWPDNLQTVTDFAIQVDAQRQNGPENSSYGVAFRLSDSNNFYYFGVSDVGQYYVGKQVNSEWTTLIDWTDSSSINSGQVNTLKVVAVGNQFTLYINGDLIDFTTDDAFSSGLCGLSIELYNAGDEATIVFDNFVLDAP
jgi:hypothetical protein